MPEASTLTNFTLHLAALSYLAGAGALLIGGARHSAALPAGVLGALLHLFGLAATLFLHQSLSSSFYDALSMTALIVVAATLGSQWSHPTRVVLVPLYSLAALFVLASIYFGHYHPIVAPSRGILLHIVSSISAYALLCAAALYAALLLATESQLRNHTRLWAGSLPPLQQTESTLFHLITAGWILLSVAIVSGLVFLQNVFAQHLLHKTVLSLLSWCLFSVLLAGHRLYGWRGRVAAVWTLGAFSALILAYLGSKFVLDVLLDKL